MSHLRRRSLLALAIAAVGLMLSGGYAEAEPLRRGAELTLKGSNGYRFYIERSDGFLLVLAVRGELRHQGTLKEAAGAGYVSEVATPNPNGIEAHLGKLGRISVRFKPSGPLHRLPDTSRGCYEARRPGMFVGTIDFNGEHDYTDVKTHRARGRLTLERGDCGTFDRPAGPESEATALRRLVGQTPTGVGLQADHEDRRYAIEFTATAGPGSDLAPEHSTKAARRYFQAVSFGEYRQITVIRAASVASEDPGSFVFNDQLTSFSATPPPPFAGSGSLTRPNDTDAGPWEGSLSVELPGAPHTALAGPGFEAKVNHDGFEAFPGL
jgi:hypothetical protein